MAFAPKIEDFPKIRKVLKFYQVFAYVTGIMLLLLCVEMVVKYGLEYQLFAHSNYGALTFVSVHAVPPPTGLNLSIGVLIAHGWLYVVYLFSDFWLWSLMRWPAKKFIAIALGGVVPFLSFFVEARISKQVTTYLAQREAEENNLVEVTH